MMKEMRIYLDDVRPMPPGFTHVARSGGEFYMLLEKARREGYTITAISFDHDLGVHPTYGEATGRHAMDVFYAIVAFRHVQVSDDLKVMVHTANPAARGYMEYVARDIEALAREVNGVSE